MNNNNINDNEKINGKEAIIEILKLGFPFLLILLAYIFFMM